MSIPTTFLEDNIELYNPLVENWAFVIGILLSIFYARLGFWYLVKMLLFIMLSIIINYWIGNNVNLLTASIIIFVAAWIGQFYGHKVEGAKPSFLKDIEFLLIGPLWVIEKLTK
jgi:uncharacterized membrane protein YGL010W